MALIRLNNQSLTNVTALPYGVGGKVLQVVNASFSSVVSTSSTSFVSLGSPAIEATITPTNTSSKILIRFMCAAYTNNTGEGMYTTVFRGTVASGTNLGNGASGLCRFQGTNSQNLNNMPFEVMDSPATTSATTYQIGFRSTNAADKYFFHDNKPGEIVLMEIAG